MDSPCACFHRTNILLSTGEQRPIHRRKSHRQHDSDYEEDEDEDEDEDEYEYEEEEEEKEEGVFNSATALCFIIHSLSPGNAISLAANVFRGTSDTVQQIVVKRDVDCIVATVDSDGMRV